MAVIEEVLHTERLLLRPIFASDADDIFEYSNNPHVGPNAGWKPHVTKEETRKIMNELFINKQNIWGIVLKYSSKLIGTIGLVNDPKRENVKAKMIGYSIGEPYWGKGITTEAAQAVIKYGFRTLGLEIIAAYCYPFNSRSKKVIEKCGLKYEGTIRLAERIFNGNIYDNLCFSITAKEYESIQGY